MGFKLRKSTFSMDEYLPVIKFVTVSLVNVGPGPSLFGAYGGEI